MAFKFIFLLQISMCLCYVHDFGTTFEEDDINLNFNCPEMCKCSFFIDEIICQNNDLTVLPAHLNPEVKILDLSYNSFKFLPKNLQSFKKLTDLYMSHNQISDFDVSFVQIRSLQIFKLNNNNLRSWNRIHPESFNYTTLIQELDLSNNLIRNVSTGIYLNSTSLKVLNMKNCSLSSIPILFLSQLPEIRTLILSNNEQLRTFKQVKSSSLENLEITNCNLDEINLSGFTNLKFAILRSNRISKISNFQNNKLEYLDLSDNTIKHINQHTFRNLPNLRILNMSMNVFIDLHKDTFSKNQLLNQLIISRTYLQHMVHFSIKSLKVLDLSINEIQEFKNDSLAALPSIEVLKLGKNSINHLPLYIKSTSLRELDLSNNRISEIKNNSLTYLTNLKSLNLIGNKLTNFNPKFFPKHLTDIYLENNIWRCDCFSKDFKYQHDYLLGPPGLTNINSLKCNSPENLVSLSWYEACGRLWYNTGNGMIEEKAWIYVITLLLVMSVIFCTILCIRRMYQVKQIREEAERHRMRLEAQERLNRLRREQQRQLEAQQNAPDPRELQRPPSYHEAIRMPRLDGSYSSLTASHISIAASNPELSKRAQSRERLASGSKSGERSSKTRRSRHPKNDDDRRERRRRRRRRTAGSSGDLTEGTDGSLSISRDEENLSDEDISRSLASVSRPPRNTECHSEEEIIGRSTQI